MIAHLNLAIHIVDVIHMHENCVGELGELAHNRDLNLTHCEGQLDGHVSHLF